MPILGSSPLGLTSTSEESTGYTIGTYVPKTVDGVTGYKSLFQNTVFEPYSGNTDPIGGREIGDEVRDNIHSNDIYDTSIISLIDYTSKYPAMVLLPSDFAFCKDVGVFPNNRLIIARRFPSPIGDDLTKISAQDKVAPLSTLVSWVPDGDDFIKLKYGEEWIAVEQGNFVGVLNEIGGELTTRGIGDIASRAAGVIPLPGVMEGLQYQVMKKMGITAGQIPAGNPNLIREAMRRKVLKNGEVGSGLKGKFSVKMVVEYEQKYINGIDPTLAYYDIIANALAFGTSDSYFQFNGKFNKGVNNFIQDLQNGNVKGVVEAVKLFVSAIADGIKKVAQDLINTFTVNYEAAVKATKNAVSNPSDAVSYTKAVGSAFMSTISKITKDTVGAVIGKYKIRIIGILNAMTGSNSTPWHVTIGNPKKPIFSSGDMYVEGVDLTLGPILSFNDLPSSVRLEFTLTSARNLGSQEIFNKFNNGSGRSYKRINITMHETTKYVVRKDINDDEWLEPTDADMDDVFPRLNNYPQVDDNNIVPDDAVVNTDAITPIPDDTNPIVEGDDSEVLPELVIDVDRAQVEEGEFYYSYKALTRTSNDIISGTAPTEAEAEELIRLFTEGDIVMHKEIIKISIPKNNGTNQS